MSAVLLDEVKVHPVKHQRDRFEVKERQHQVVDLEDVTLNKSRE